jgi:glycosyltransferase involved in cell wall biosynthesis
MPSSAEPVGVTIIVPCYNEVAGLRHLQEKLTSAGSNLERTYTVSVLLVDDGSTDGTWKLMHDLFANRPNWTLLRHSMNRGIGAAIWTGIREAKTGIVCSIDADCSYDPCALEKLIPALSPGVDLVTASPYHPAGTVVGVSKWRLLLSRAASFLYRQVLRQKLYTYTSCFRIYRRSSILNVNLRRHDFLAIAELIGKLDLQGSVVVECPTTLTMRIYGNSKMKTARILFRHLYLLAELLTLRMRRAIFSRPRPVIRAFDFNQN